MTVVAGIFARKPGIPIKDSVCESLKRLISRQHDEEVILFRDRRVCLAKVDIGAYREPAYRVDPSGTVTMLAGEPLLESPDGAASNGRTQELEWLHQAWDSGNWDILQKTHGVFSAVHYSPQGPAVTLVTDKLGIRPMYYWADDSYMIFASALRILEKLPELPKTMDLRAVTEIAAFGYPLGTRTGYANVLAARAAEIVRCCEMGIETRQYWRWDAIPVSERSEPELLEELHQRFKRAVERRLRGDTTVVALLSGGLDSRCVVAALRALQKRVLTFNFSVAGSPDQIFGAEFATKIGTLHHETVIRIGHPETFERMAKAWEASKYSKVWPPERPETGWSGNGGSVGLGHVYMYPEVVALLRSGQINDAIEKFFNIEKKSILCRLLRPDVNAALCGILHAGVREELEGIHCSDVGRSFHVFLLLNDQRHHLMAHFENIDLHRLEFHEPFYDSDILQLVISTPIDFCMEHRFYNKWLKLFQSEVTSVPWQSYPGHEPCPLPIATELRSPWTAEDRAALRKSVKSSLLENAGEMLQDKHFPDAILNKWYLRLGFWVYRVGLRNYDYLLETALTYHHYWTECNGAYVMEASS